MKSKRTVMTGKNKLARMEIRGYRRFNRHSKHSKMVYTDKWTWECPEQKMGARFIVADITQDVKF